MRLGVAALAVAACGSARPYPVLGQLPAAAQLLDADRTAFTPAERYRGHVTVLDFWAGWCEECKKMVPALARLDAAFTARGLIVVGVDTGEAPESALAYARTLGITYPIALDPDFAYSDQLDAQNLPIVLVIDRAGAVVHRSRRLDAETLGVIRQQLDAR